MKAIVLLLIIGSFVLTTSSCGKDDDVKKPANYADISLADIKAKESLLSGNTISSTNAGGIIWKPGDVYIFKTRSGRFGKFRVVSINAASNYDLTIAAVIYNQDGSIAEQRDSIVIRGTWGCNLEILAEDPDPLDLDFHWGRANSTDTYLSPENGARFMKYVF